MSELTRFRDYCRRMSETEPGVLLWRALADEIDAYLEPMGGDLATDLFGMTAREPETYPESGA